MQSRTIRRGILAVFAVFFAWLMPWVVSAGVAVTPAVPTAADNVQLGVTWSVPTPCYNGTYNFSVTANRIRIDLTTTQTSSLCAQVIIDRSVTVPVGVLAAGNYAVEVYNRWGATAAFELLFTAAFDVVASDVVVVPQDGQAVHLAVKPLPPSNYDVELLSAWVMPSACFASSGTTTVSGNTIRADITVTSTGSTCALQLSRGTYFSGSLGELMPGKYTAATYFNGVPGISRELTIMPTMTPTNVVMSVTPITPSSADNVIVLVSAVLPSSCFEYLGNRVVTASGSEIRLDIPLIGTHAGCVQQPTPHEAQFYPGKMAPGTYTVRAYYNGALGLTKELVIKPVADMAISQTVTPNPVKRNRLVMQNITVANSGPDAAGGVIVKSQLPDNLSFVAAKASQGSCKQVSAPGGRRMLTCALGTLSAGATAKIGILSRARSAGTASLVGTLESDAFDPNYINNYTQTSILIRNND